MNSFPRLSLLAAAFALTAASSAQPVHQVIYHDDAVYSAWPALVRAANDDLILTFIRTEQHMSPDGHVALMRSTDNGVTWAPPVTAVDTPLDDRESGLTVAPHGELLLHVRSVFWKPETYDALGPEAYARPMLERWMKEVTQPAYLAAADQEGSHLYSSPDHGKSWTHVGWGPDSIHGGITLQDGTLLTTSYREDRDSIRIYHATHSKSDWQLLKTVSAPGAPHLRFGEPHVAQLPSGRIVVMIRATATPYDDHQADLFLWQTYSDDNGTTWADPIPTPMLGFPPHLLVLADGRLLCTYGRRRAPFGQRAMVSTDGITWTHGKEITLRDDAPNHDLGYPVSIETSPGKILTVYYQKPAWDPANKHRYTTAIFTTHWELPPTP
jgi:sialidase-1